MLERPRLVAHLDRVPQPLDPHTVDPDVPKIRLILGIFKMSQGFQGHRGAKKLPVDCTRGKSATLHLFTFRLTSACGALRERLSHRAHQCARHRLCLTYGAVQKLCSLSPLFQICPSSSPLSTAAPTPGAPRARTPARTKKVLLVDDDATFQEIMKDFLIECGFNVVAVQNGVEGVHEVLASDFEIILCDMMMPTLPGDMFYRAVERMRPHLCQRFVFMTGHRGNQKVNEFITQVKGTILNKPFKIDDLLEMIAFIQVRVMIKEAA